MTTAALPRPEVAPPQSWRLPKPAEALLDNGLRVIVLERPGQHIVSAELVLELPLSCEPLDVEGVAAITADCLAEGTRAHPGNDFADAVENLGAGIDGFSGLAASQLSLDVPAPNLEPALRLLAEAVAEPTLGDEDVSRLRALRLAEIDQERADPHTRAWLAFRRACIPARFRAARPGGGLASTVNNVNGEAVRDFWAANYRPQAATLILAGDFVGDPLAAAATAFQGWRAVARTEPDEQRPYARKPRAVLIDRPHSVQAEVRLGGFAVDRSHPDYLPLQIACRAMGGSFLSRLNKVLREVRGYSYGVHISNNPLRHGGLLSMQGSFRTEVAAEAIAEAQQILDIAQQPFTDVEISEAIAHAQGSFPLGLATADRVSGYLASLLHGGLGLDYIDHYLESLQQITAEQASQVLARYLPPDGLTLVVVADAQALADPLREAGWALRIR